MIVNHITIKLLLDGEIKKAGVLDPHNRIIVECKVISYYMIDGVWILKLKPAKTWTTGHTILYRSLEEVF